MTCNIVCRFGLSSQNLVWFAPVLPLLATGAHALTHLMDIRPHIRERE
jgi:hypothetical protein